MTGKQTVLVVGATGTQGGGVAHHLLQSDRWAVRALTRNPDSPAAAALAERGAELVQGDLGDADSVARAVKGVHGMFLVTDWWSLGTEQEYALGSRAVRIALESGVEHLVYSSLPEAKARSHGELHVPQHDSKARIESELRAQGAPVSFVLPSMYYENWPVRRLRRDDDGGLSFALPHGDVPLPMVCVQDLGGVVRAVFDGGADFHGSSVGVVGDARPCQEYADILTEALGVPVRYRDLPYREYAELLRPGAESLADMFELSRRHLGGRFEDLARSRELFPEISSFGEWVGRNTSAFAHLLEG